jgi:hypothetical protein
MVTIGDAAPGVTLLTPAGQPVSLADSWCGGRHTLLVFLRHLG